jgi:hypothetical protein
MAKRIPTDLRSRPEPSQPAVTLLGRGDQQRLPLDAGSIVAFAPGEKEALLQAGWREGEPIPAEMPELLAQVEAARRESVSFRSPVPAGTPPVRAETTDISALPPDQQKAYYEAVRNAIDVAKSIQAAAAAQIPGAAPGVNESIAAGRGIDLTNEGYRPLDPRELAQGWPQGPTAPPRPQPQHQPQPQAQPQPARPVSAPHVTTPSPQPPPQAPPVPPAAGGDGATGQCSHCGWDLRVRDDVPVIQEDVYTFLASVGAGQRFRKRYVLYEGRLAVTFRGLTAREADMAYRQIAIDAQRDALKQVYGPQAALWSTLDGYRLVMSLESIESREQGKIEVPEVGSVECDAQSCPAPNTPLFAWYGRVLDAALPTEALRRIVGLVYYRFEALKSKLEARADDPNLLRLTGSPP